MVYNDHLSCVQHAADINTVQLVGIYCESFIFCEICNFKCISKN